MDPAALVIYAAGFFDGEGSVNICMTKQKSTGRSYHRLFVTVSQVNPAPLHTFKERWGGTVMGKANEKTNAKWRPAFHWQIADAGAEAFLQEIKPYCTIKTRDIDIALRFRALKCKRGSLQGESRGTPRQQEVHDAREAIRLELLERRTA